MSDDDDDDDDDEGIAAINLDYSPIIVTETKRATAIASYSLQFQDVIWCCSERNFLPNM